LLELAVRMYEEDEWAVAALRERYAAFTVDEYQDVNLLQQSLLELWLGPRDDLCAVGDDYQSIYGFTGASPEWLLGLATRYPHADRGATGGELPLLAAGARAREPARAEARRRREVAARDEALKVRSPELRGFGSPEDEGAWILERVRALHAEGVPYEEMAVLMRLNARSGRLRRAVRGRGHPRSRARRCSRATARGSC
jgi:DNA helicase-2/ATP-dependent DNA helicase PcrA